MNKYVEGNYQTVEEAVHAVKALFTQGYAKEDLLIVTNEAQKPALMEQTGVETTSNWSLEQEHDGRDKSMVDKLKQTFTGDSDVSDNKDLLADYQENLEKGQILVLAETAPEVDRDPTTDPNSGYDNHSSIEKPDVSSIPQTTDGFKKEHPGDLNINNSDLFHRP